MILEMFHSMRYDEHYVNDGSCDSSATGCSNHRTDFTSGRIDDDGGRH